MLDSTVGQLRLMQVGIRRRLRYRQEAHDVVIEWQTRQLASFIAASVGGKGGKELAKEAMKIRLRPQQRSDTSGGALEADADFSFIETGSPVALSRNRPGSFEAMARGIGGGGG